MAEPAPMDDMGGDMAGGDMAGGDMAAGDMAAGDEASDKPFDDEPFDAGVEADEETDPKKFIEQLTGKLGQSLRKYTEEQGQPDFELEKFAINSLLSATHTSEMDAEDQKDIITKVRTAGEGDDKPSPEADMPSDEEAPAEEPMGDEAPIEEPAGEEGLEEYSIYENMDNLFVNPKKNNMFQEGSNDILDEACWKGYKKDGMKTMFGKKYPNCVKVNESESTDEYEVYDVIEEGKKKKKKTKKDACYHKVKSRYDVWPSAYGSGALVQCRKVGADKWGESTDESVKVNEAFDKEKIKQNCTKIAKRKHANAFPSVKAVQDIKNCVDNEIKKLSQTNESVEEAKKTDFSLEKKSGLHGWFSRRGGEGSEGWIDCNTCRDGECKPCGRKEGEKRSKYPSCRPKPSACKSKGKGDSWGKKAANESEYNVYENLDNMDESNNYMFWQNLKSINDNAAEILGMDMHQVDNLLSDGHNWAVEHVITSKDDVEEVYHFLEYNMESKPEMMAENADSNNYMFFASLKTILHASSEIMEMDEDMVDSILSDGHGWAIDHIATAADDMEEVYHFLANTLNAYDGDTNAGYEDEFGNVEAISLNEAKYKGRTVKLGKPMKGDVKKFKVFVKNKGGNVVKVNFGDPNMEIKRDNPKRRKSFRARHKCAQAKDRTTPKYWSCRMWSKKPVSKMIEEGLFNSEKSSIFDKMYLKGKLHETFNQDDTMNQPMTEPAPVITPTKPTEKPVITPSRKDKPFLPIPEVAPDPKAIKEGKFDYETYHETLSSALDAIRNYSMNRGYDEFEFGMGDVQHVGYGNTERFTKELTKNGKPQRKALHVQIYRMDSGNYELNMYIN
jgi:hypothetical protein